VDVNGKAQFMSVIVSGVRLPVQFINLPDFYYLFLNNSHFLNRYFDIEV